MGLDQVKIQCPLMIPDRLQFLKDKKRIKKRHAKVLKAAKETESEWPDDTRRKEYILPEVPVKLKQCGKKQNVENIINSITQISKNRNEELIEVENEINEAIAKHYLRHQVDIKSCTKCSKEGFIDDIVREKGCSNELECPHCESKWVDADLLETQ